MNIKNAREFANSDFFKAASEHISNLVKDPNDITKELILAELDSFIEILIEDAQITVSHRIEVEAILEEHKEAIKEFEKQQEAENQKEGLNKFGDPVNKYGRIYSSFCMNCNQMTDHNEFAKPDGGGYLLCNICDPITPKEV